MNQVRIPSWPTTKSREGGVGTSIKEEDLLCLAASKLGWLITEPVKHVPGWTSTSTYFSAP